MKRTVLAALALAAPALLLAQTATPKPAPKAAAVKPAQAAKRAPIKRSAAKAVEEVTPIDDDPSVTLTPEDLELAKRVYVGTIPCELGASVTVTPSTKRPGFFLVQTSTAKFYMHPVGSRTGAIRLEDGRRGAMWLQLGNKSMLMSQKLGQRLADECMSPVQSTFAEEMKKNPPVSILEPLPAAKPATALAGTGSAQPALPAKAE
ncbi:hypothetical protein [Polaromonas sp.]|uniref:hypothetical protein n=1 Tax=Polaromonas sp. TaxID=1869339 RepID=UPI00248A2A9C|nr:hypothetical protein [Polaromonas sp.]MDI1272695.1 hypothetical protein [Polaromonas sp.]